MGAFMIIVLKVEAQEAYDRFRDYHHHIRHYRDASKGDCYYDCTLLHCLQGLEFGIEQGWYNFRTFNIKDYEYYERVENGDLNWIIPGKFVAFMGPLDRKEQGQRSGITPEQYV